MRACGASAAGSVTEVEPARHRRHQTAAGEDTTNNTHQTNQGEQSLGPRRTIQWVIVFHSVFIRLMCVIRGSRSFSPTSGAGAGGRGHGEVPRFDHTGADRMLAGGPTSQAKFPARRLCCLSIFPPADTIGAGSLTPRSGAG